MDRRALRHLAGLECAGSELRHRTCILLLFGHAREVLLCERVEAQPAVACIVLICLSIHLRRSPISVLSPQIPARSDREIHLSSASGWYGIRCYRNVQMLGNVSESDFQRLLRQVCHHHRLALLSALLKVADLHHRLTQSERTVCDRVYLLKRFLLLQTDASDFQKHRLLHVRHIHGKRLVERIGPLVI